MYGDDAAGRNPVHGQHGRHGIGGLDKPGGLVRLPAVHQPGIVVRGVAGGQQHLVDQLRQFGAHQPSLVGRCEVTHGRRVVHDPHSPWCLAGQPFAGLVEVQPHHGAGDVVGGAEATVPQPVDEGFQRRKVQDVRPHIDPLVLRLVRGIAGPGARRSWVVAVHLEGVGSLPGMHKVGQREQALGALPDHGHAHLVPHFGFRPAVARGPGRSR